MKYSVQILFLPGRYKKHLFVNKTSVISCAGAASSASARTTVDQPSKP